MFWLAIPGPHQRIGPHQRAYGPDQGGSGRAQSITLETSPGDRAACGPALLFLVRRRARPDERGNKITNSSLELLPTLKLALTQLEAIPSQPGPNVEFWIAVEGLQHWVKRLEEVEQAEEEAVVQLLKDILLRRKGICVVGWTSARKVKAILQANGFGRLSHEESNASLCRDMELSLGSSEAVETLEEIEELIEQDTARDVVPRAGLEWSKPEGN